MKILFLGETTPSSTSVFYFNNLLKLGHQVVAFDPSFFKPIRSLDSIKIRYKKQPVPKRMQWVSKHLGSLCKTHSFDLIFVMGQNFLPPTFVQQMRGHSPDHCKIVFHSHDNLYSPGVLKGEDFLSSLRQYNAVFTTKSQNVARYRAAGQTKSYYLPSAYEPTVHRPISSAHSHYKQSFEVTFVGTYDDSRNPFLEQAGWDRLHVWGNGWKRAPDYRKHRRHITNHAIYAFDLADVVSHSQCSLGLLREEAHDKHTQRTFELPACGSLQICPRNEEILQYFDEGKEIICFQSPEELREKVDYYLGHEGQRSKIARAGYERVTKGHHTYVDRIKEILKLASLDA